VPKNLNERMEGEEACFWYFFIDLERPKSFAYIPTHGIKTNVVHLKNRIGDLD